MRFIRFLDRKYALGLLTGIIFGVLSVYTDFFRDTDAKLTFEILSNVRVIDIKEDIGKIDILYDSTSILKKKQTLTVITLKITNSGQTDILRDHFDPKSPLGFKIQDGEVLERPVIIQSSDTYLTDNLEYELIQKNKVVFHEFTFDKGEFVTFKILVLNSINKVPEIDPEGKVAGIKNLGLLKSGQGKEKQSFWSKVIEGNALVHITRFFTYMFGFVALVLVIVIPTAFISDLVTNRKRKRNVSNFIKYYSKEPSLEEFHLLNFYKKNGLFPIEQFYSSLTSYKDFRKLYRLAQNTQNRSYIEMHKRHRSWDLPTVELIKSLMDKKYVIVSEGSVEVSSDLRVFIETFIKFLSK